jgi:predicted histone-like DNA-binding protein
MKYRVIKRGNPANPAAPKKQYASAVNAGKFTLKNLSKEIAGRSSLTRGDIENTLNNCVDIVPTFLKLGLSVQLGGLGTFRVIPLSEGVDEDKEFTVANIKGSKIVFTPGTELKKSLEDIVFEEEK